ADEGFPCILKVVAGERLGRSSQAPDRPSTPRKRPDLPGRRGDVYRGSLGANAPWAGKRGEPAPTLLSLSQPRSCTIPPRGIKRNGSDTQTHAPVNSLPRFLSTPIGPPTHQPTP